jgi:hypothetical protein
MQLAKGGGLSFKRWLYSMLKDYALRELMVFGGWLLQTDVIILKDRHWLEVICVLFDLLSKQSKCVIQRGLLLLQLVATHLKEGEPFN